MSVKTKQILRMIGMWIIIASMITYGVLFITSIIKQFKNSDDLALVLIIYYAVGLALVFICKKVVDDDTPMIMQTSNIFLTIALLLIYPVHVVIQAFSNMAFAWGYTVAVFRKHTGFDPLSITRFLLTILITFGGFIAMYFISADHSNNIESVDMIGYIFTFAVVVIYTFLYDVLDFEDHDKKVLRIVKNVLFFIIYAAVLFIVWVFFCAQRAPWATNSAALAYQCMGYAAPITTILVYYYIIRSQYEPSTFFLTKFLGIVAYLVGLLIGFLGSVLVGVTPVLYIIFLILLSVAPIVLTIFFGFPFRKLEREARGVNPYSGGSSSGSGSSNYSGSSYDDDDGDEDYVSGGANLKKEFSFGSKLKDYMYSQSIYCGTNGGVYLKVIQIAPYVYGAGSCEYKISYQLQIDKDYYIRNDSFDEYQMKSDVEYATSELKSKAEDLIQSTLSEIRSLAEEYEGYGGRQWKVNIKFDARQPQIR